MAPVVAGAIVSDAAGSGAFASGQIVGNQRVGVAMTHAVFGLEPGDHFHVLLVAGRFKQIEPVVDGLPVLLFD